MYIISGKGTVAGVDLASYILHVSQKHGVQWDDDLPQYTIDFFTKIPSISKSIREGKEQRVIDLIQERLDAVANLHQEALILCMSAQPLISKINSKIKVINLWDIVEQSSYFIQEKYAFLGTAEAYTNANENMVLLPDHDEKIGDLITSIKRGYARYSEGFSAHPKHLLELIVEEYKSLGVTHFFIACTDLHLCNEYIVELGYPSSSVMDIIEIVGDAIIKKHGRSYDVEFADLLSDLKSSMRYKYLAKSDSLNIDKKFNQLEEIIKVLPDLRLDSLNILDIGGSSTGNAYYLANSIGVSSNITIHDISESSIELAQKREVQNELLTYNYICGDVSSLNTYRNYDFILCLGVFLFLSSDINFEQVVFKLYSMINTGGILITRDGVYDKASKYYLDFGGVVRNEGYYDNVIESVGFVKVAEERFMTKFPIERTIKTVAWQKV